jgi:hypothetical protein
MLLCEIGYDQKSHDLMVEEVISFCKLLKPSDISKVIHKLVTGYFLLYRVDESEINKGMCEDFANDLVSIFQLAWGYDLDLHWGEDLLDCDWDSITSNYAHCFVEFEGKYYDSEMPNGTKDWKHSF